jgi:hypothetical protein
LIRSGEFVTGTDCTNDLAHPDSLEQIEQGLLTHRRARDDIERSKVAGYAIRYWKLLETRVDL